MSMELIPHERIEGRIYLFRGKKVMVDRDLAQLYGVATKVLNQAVQRNLKRFPDDFMFQLSKDELNIWRSQIVTSNKERMGLRRSPFVFTEQGVAMLSSVLKSERAITVNIQIMRTFTRMREMLAENTDLRRKIELMEKQYDEQFSVVFEAIRRLSDHGDEDQIEIGFKNE